ncbi:hypothetical protein [Sporanaerobacter acetigenes]|uniref:Uncharacterized protein n=2 Tax=Sporanaerobacter acetigenes TaxID=165813 RepID=A0A1M5YKI1_9FIRM|nr:hypothetical protein SAMN02745180_02272 [Sporanaerobacter acetigenes DSM 13106]
MSAMAILMIILKIGVKYMKIKDLLKIGNESDRVSALYDIFEEGTRLSTKVTQVEFLTT